MVRCLIAVATLVVGLMAAGCVVVPPPYGVASTPVPQAQDMPAGAPVLPPELREPPPDNPLPTTVRQSPADFVGREVRWGGLIVNAESDRGRPLVEVSARPLDSAGEPQSDARAQGRFMVYLPTGYDPGLLDKGRPLTIAGVVRGTSAGLPLVDAHAYYLWGTATPTYQPPPPQPRTQYYYYPAPAYPYWGYPYGYYYPWDGFVGGVWWPLGVDLYIGHGGGYRGHRGYRGHGGYRGHRR